VGPRTVLEVTMASWRLIFLRVMRDVYPRLVIFPALGLSSADFLCWQSVPVPGYC
jgi:hypothetical protein